ncbi:MAG: zinc/iron permease [Pedobacter sp.]|nr:MAG: zinc/iron permease [Pedobacter sp.]
MHTWKLLLLFFAAFLGGVAIFMVKSDRSKLLKLILSFSGAYLFGITVLELIPEVYHGPEGSEIGLYIILGFLLQIFLEQFSEGVEHGHIHRHNETKIFPFGIMFSLCLHGFIEGMPLAKEQNNELIFGISLHHIPAAFALASILMQNQFRKASIVFYISIFAIMAPLGFFISYSLNNVESGMDAYFNKMMGVVIGIFLHISTTILFESNADHKIDVRKMVAVLTGIAIAVAGYFAGGHSH